jgi:ribonuclease BN (tRNA processing enzyme)
VLVDCGFGTFASFRNLASGSDLRAVVLSHAHRDHYADVSDFLARASSQPVAAIASANTFDALAETIDILGAERIEVGPESHIELGPFVLEFSSTTHQIPTLSVRLSVGDRHVVFSADTGPGWHVPNSWRQPDVAILECTYAEKDKAAWPYHLSSKDVAELAEEIDAATTLITHVPPRADPTERLRLAQRAAPRRLFVLAELGQRIVIASGDVYK